jgi:hypothetical protein
MTLMEIYTLVSAVLLLYVAMMWSDTGFLNMSIKLAYYITGTVGMVFTIAKFMPGIV